MNSIFHRTSIRKFKNTPVESEKIDMMMKAAMQAPSAGNQQPWEFYITDNKEIIQKLSKVSPYSGCLADAPLAIVVCAKKECRMSEYAYIDCSIACENLWLEADELGLGAVWLGIAPLVERMRAVEDIVQMPDSLEAFALFAVGYPDQIKEQQDRYDPDRIHYIK